MLSNAEYNEKQAELTRLARAIDIWKNTPQTAAQKKKVAELMQELQAETFALECAFLDRKTQIFTKLLAVLKKEL